MIYRVYNNIPADPPKPVSLPADTTEKDDHDDHCDDEYDDEYDDDETIQNTNGELFRRVAAVGIAAYIMHRSGF